MNYSVDTDLKTPAYLQIYEQLREDIINGTYTYGSKIPSKRLLSLEIGVSVITIMHSLELLCDEGYLESRQRSGYFVIFKKDDFLGAPVHTVTPLENVENSLRKGDFPYSVLAKTIRKVLLDYSDKILVKSPNYGCTELREEISAYLARSRSIYVKPSQIIIGSGAEYLYGLIAQFFGAGTKFAIESPSYSKIHQVYDAFNISYDSLTLYPDGLSSDDLKNTGATVLHTTPFNSYPTGVSINSSKKHEYIRWAVNRNGFIVEDNYDSELTVSSKPEDSLFSISGGENVIYLNTFSQTIAPSIRIGYMILPERLLPEFDQKLGFYSCTVPLFSQYVLTELIHNGDFERHINRIRRKKRKLS
ncbi:MAG: PLP-dependent aminotransferase family protein [Lachnospiraceae bacterium]|nr:PLP-dependent aminotransferase family protein [Lachnospiraceae bacterium]